MPHESSLISLMAIGLGVAMVMGFIASKLRMPPLVGYLIAGILIGPATPGMIADVSLASQLAEIGVMLLMFGVGLHFSLEDLLSVKRIALPGAILQIVTATLMGMAAAHFWGWSLGAGLVFGLCLSCASTVVLLRALEDRNQLESVNGRIAIGWLVVEDLVMVMVLVLLPPLAPLLGADSATTHGAADTSLGMAIILTLVKVGAFIAFMLIIGRRLLPKLLWMVAKTHSRELFTLCVIAAAVSVAYASVELFGVSFALGAFFAGMMVSESELSHRAAEESLPLRDAFSVLFFLSVGMLFDPHILLEKPLEVLLVAAIIMIGKTLAAMGLVLFFRYPLNTAMTVGASLAQIGEFSFILAGLGLSLKLLSIEGQNLILAGAMISIALNSTLFSLLGPIKRWLGQHAHWASLLERSSDPLATLPMHIDESYLNQQVVLVGYGEAGQRIATQLIQRHFRLVVIDENREVVNALRQKDIAAVRGNAGEPGVLVQAHIMKAAALIVATPDLTSAPRMIETARLLNPGIAIVMCAETSEDAERLQQEGATAVFSHKQALSEVMTQCVLSALEQSAHRDPGHVEGMAKSA